MIKKILFILLLPLFVFAGNTFVNIDGKVYQLPKNIAPFSCTDGNCTTTYSMSSGNIVNNHTTAEGSGTVSLTAAQCKGQINTNQGASAEVDILAYGADVGDMWLARQEEAQVMEICPETGGYIILDGTALDQNDCIDSNGATIGSFAVFNRGKNAAGTTVWFVDSDGLWSDTGATD